MARIDELRPPPGIGSHRNARGPAPSGVGRNGGHRGRPKSCMQIIRRNAVYHRPMPARVAHATRLRQELPFLRSRLPTLWTNSYFVSTVNGATLAVIRRYTEGQKRVTMRQVRTALSLKVPLQTSATERETGRRPPDPRSVLGEDLARESKDW